MLEENKNLKDTGRDSIKNTFSKSIPIIPSLNDSFISYTKINKLIIALYMVTDTIDREEPIRLKLRTLGIEILSDISTLSKTVLDTRKIDQILSFLNIASDIRMISSMNCNILKKEFMELKESIQENEAQNHLWLKEFTDDQSEINSSVRHFKSMSDKEKRLSLNKRQNLSIGQIGTSIGVQKGSTLMKALSKIGGVTALRSFSEDRELIKKQRREEIIKIIKARSLSGVDRPNSVSIKDIVLAVRDLGHGTGEKTIQRELVSMVKDNVLKKSGKRRWSSYSLSLAQSA